jgi:nucleoside phosphorylase
MPQPIASAPVLVCFAVREEARFFPTPPPEAGIEVLLTGIGSSNARRSIESALARCRRELVLTCGFAGGLNPELPLAAVVFSADAETGLTPVLTEIGAVPAQFHGSSRILVGAAEKQALWQSSRADAVDMESDIIRQVCREKRVPSATVRAISDPAGQDLPLDFNALLTESFQIDYPKLLRAVLLSPSAVPALIRFQAETRRAARQLGLVLRHVIANRSSPEACCDRPAQ